MAKDRKSLDTDKEAKKITNGEKAAFFDGPKTEEKPGEVYDPIKPRGTGLRASEWDHFDEIAAELGSKPHALACYILRDFIKRYDAGEIKTQTQKTLPGL